MKQSRNGVAGIPRKCLEEKAETLASPKEWLSFMDVLALLLFVAVLFPNVDKLVDLAVVDAFLTYHHNKEILVIAVLADVCDTFDLRCEKIVQELSVVRLLFMYGWYPTSLIMEVDLSVLYKVIACVQEKIKQIGNSSWQA